MKKKITVYEILVFVAYGFYLLLGIAWFLMGLLREGHFNAEAFFIIGAFGAQVYYRHRLTNLILGILALAFSIWMLLDVFDTFNLMAKNVHPDGLATAMLWFCVLSMIMSGILIFSFTKLAHKDQHY